MSEELNLKNFNDTRAIYNVLGNLCNDTEMLKRDNLQLTTNDFMQRIHKIIFSAINNIAYNISGDKVTSINAKDIDNYLSSYPTQYKEWNDKQGFEYVQNIVDHANAETFNQSYSRVKKMAILREYQSMGFDVSDLYDWDSDDYLSREKSLIELDKMELKDIFEHFTLKNLKIKDSYNIETEVKQFKAGESVEDMLAQFKRGVEFGAPYDDGFSNYLLRGQRKGKLVIYSAATGNLKTSLQIKNMTHNAVGEIYRKGKWKYNGTKLPSLFISTELDEAELTVIILAYMTGISRKTIQDGHFNKEQNDLLLEAGKKLRESPLYLVHIPNFNAADIEEIIERHVLDKGVGYIAFDYIQNTSRLSTSVNKLFGSVQREDQILLYLSTSLKNLAEKYNVHINTATQVNRNSKEEENWDATSVRGGSSISDKADSHFILKKAKEKDLEKVSGIIEEQGFGNKPNYMKILFKNRSGRPDVIIWSYLDYSTVIDAPLFCTDTDYNIVEEVEDLHFNFNDDKKIDETDIKNEKRYAEEGTEVFGSIDEKNEEGIDF